MTTTEARPTVIGLGELTVSVDPTDELVCLGLGSCVCITAFDKTAGVAGMAHVVLPDSSGDPARQTPKFADFAVPELIRQMEEQGAVVSRIEFKLAGGAHMTPVAAPGDNPMNIGERNAEAVRKALNDLRCRVVAEALGGTAGRTVRLDVKSGLVSVTTAGKNQQDL